MFDVVIVRSNSIVYNPRVGKIAKSLGKRYSTSVLGWNRDRLARNIVEKFIVRLELFNMKAPFGKPSLIVYFPLYWTWVFFRLFFIERPRVVHACDLDSAIPSYVYKLISRKKLVFDVCDRYAMGYIPTKFKTLYSMVNFLEEFIGKHADVLVNVSHKLLDTFNRRPKYCAVIMNCSEDRTSGTALNPSTRRSDNNILRVTYTGNIIRNRGLAEIARVMKELNGVQLMIAGRVLDKELLDQLLEIPAIEYKGLLQPKEALALQAQSDVIISLYDPKDPISQFSMGNKIFEAMMFGIPMITNVASEVIEEANCGIIVNYNKISDIKEALVTLRENGDLRRKLGINGRKAFVQRYNWDIMEHKLYQIYDRLLKSNPNGHSYNIGNIWI